MNNGLKKFILGFKFAFEGLFYALKTQRNMRVHFLFMLMAIILSFWLRISSLEGAIIVLTITIVWALELINTALEAILDRVSEEIHPLTKVAKDVAAAAVLVSAMGAVIVGILIWGGPLYLKILN